MADETRVRRASTTARNLQTLHNGAHSYLVLANDEGIDYTDADAAMQRPDSLAEWDIAGVIVCSEDMSVVWMEVFPDHGFPTFSDEKIASEMDWDGDRDPAHYTPEYRAAKTVALIADSRFDGSGPIYLGDRVAFDSSVPHENDGLFLHETGSLDNDKRTITIHKDTGELLLHDDGEVLRFGEGFPLAGQLCTPESMAVAIPAHDLRALGALASKLPFRKMAREAMTIQERLVAK
jgi:hypothetical protein